MSSVVSSSHFPLTFFLPVPCFRATTNKKLRETVALELSYVNSTLQLLKEELADLNSSVQVYQSHGYVMVMLLGHQWYVVVEVGLEFEDKCYF